ncbi:MAG: hypothetical protein ACYDHH_26740 [Solirubrobacteraceae bacterium]
MPIVVMPRLRVMLRRWKLDEQLAAGNAPSDSADLALRAEQLTAPSQRHHLAEALRDADAERRGPRLGSVVPICRDAVTGSREALLGLAERLDGHAAVCACGVARANLLVVDGTSALYNPGSASSLADRIWWIADGLEGCSCGRGCRPAAPMHCPRHSGRP